MDECKHYARSVKDMPESEWQGLVEHLEGVSDLAAEFASAFECAEWGRLAGLWHDLGKYQQAFQERLRGSPQSVDHGVVGALLARCRNEPDDRAIPLACIITGHHGGLKDLLDVQQRWKRNDGTLSETLPTVPQNIRDAALPELPDRFRLGRKPTRTEVEQLRRTMEFWTRFLYSALVDADSLDAEQFETPGKRVVVSADTIPELRRKLDSYLHCRFAKSAATPVNQVRHHVLEACRDAAQRPPGTFSLSVPTGGGKTFSAMAFALRHAELHGLRRVIVVIPYTSIIEQNADKYREALGDANVIEHHSNLDPTKETDRNKSASEN